MANMVQDEHVPLPLSPLERGENTALLRPRLHSIDLVRGLIMVIMALDHVRDFFFTHTIDPTNLSDTSPGLFFTRWITHFCAPTFLLLAGVGIALTELRGRKGAALSTFLFTRGLWLIFLEWCVVRTLGWAWNFDFTYLPCWVIWTLGWSMIVMAGLVRLPRWVPVVFGLTLICGHHLVDGVKAEQLGPMRIPWYFLHDPHGIVYHPDRGWVAQDEVKDFHGLTIGAGYPLIPWVGVMALGYGLGAVYGWDAKRRRTFLLMLGLICIMAFFAWRYANLYGETNPWSMQVSDASVMENGVVRVIARQGAEPLPRNARIETLWTVMSFLNCTKQPPSLCFLLMTLGPVLLLLAWWDRGVGPWAKPFIIFGKVPLFFYLLHLPLIHALCVAGAWWQLGSFPHWLFTNPPLGDMPVTFGYPLWVSYVVWIIVVVSLYPLCHWFAGVKQRNKSPWLSYL